MSDIEQMIKGLHKTTVVLSRGHAIVLGHTVPAIETYNKIYSQTLVWGMFNVERGKFKGNRKANNASTEGVEYARELLERECNAG